MTKDNLNHMKMPDIRVVDDDFEVEFGLELIKNADELDPRDSLLDEIANKSSEVKDKLIHNNERLDELNSEIDRLTNHADGLDYIVAVGSGVLAGVIDSLWVGEFSLERGSDWGKEKVDKFVVKVAQMQGYEGDDIEGAIRKLEGFGAPSDSNTMDLGGSLQHHLRDFAHHPTLVGLIFSMLTQFTGKAYGTDTNGLFKVVDVKDKKLIGKDIPQKFLFGTVYWFFHMVSDMAGSSSTPGAGTGLPGPLLSLAKELSVLPFFQNMKVGEHSLSEWISKLFNGTLLAKRDADGRIVEQVRFDLRAELGVMYELGRQAIPVIINECIVRGFYFIRRLAMEIKEKDIRQFRELNRVDWDRVKPFKNRTIVRMLTIATGTFTAVDMVDAAIRGGLKSGGNAALFAKEFLLRVNFVGVGRFAIAVSSDVFMGVKRSGVRNERMMIMGEQLHLKNAQIFYKQAEMWIAAEKTEDTINEVIAFMENTTIYFMNALEDNSRSLEKIGSYKASIEENDSALLDEINDILKWG
ncbi:hypothetical protein NYQ66_03020 [Aquibacillus koreensis]|uniref:hypothetical protein n=1 Tax=Aquibacillus koreensis TaxID=279446 RepID=UPI0021A8D497|nr:hypothetical protein [Aquibacillus koreensis]MCT2534750.1 hypothetical protein [Aquibacillus koreensis]